MAPTIYLAGPEVFHPDALDLGRAKQRLCAQRGWTGLFPLDGAVEPKGPAIFAANVALIRRADAIIANLTPFRGPSADAGTVWELGFALGLGKPAAAYRNVADRYFDRVAAWNGVPLTQGKYDRDGLEVERFGLGDNLMIDGALLEQGRPVVELVAAFTDMAGFITCLGRLTPVLTALVAQKAGP
jgi:nucleoside 2-deoxyribosyltransferase